MGYACLMSSREARYAAAVDSTYLINSFPPSILSQIYHIFGKRGGILYKDISRYCRLRGDQYRCLALGVRSSSKVDRDRAERYQV